MEVITGIAQMRHAVAHAPRPLGFVPTMGALHAGHAALVRRARRECATVAVSIFVNPLQFGPSEDFERYPRDLDADCRLLSDVGVDIVFAPGVDAMYPRPPDVVVVPDRLARFFEGERRPGHFRGVATVVLKLLNVVRPERAYFGQKDAQQLAVVQRLVVDLNLDVEIVACETVRDADGLALSSRNRYLSEEERRAAPHLYAALREAARRLEAGDLHTGPLLVAARRELPPLREDYLAVVRPHVFEPLDAVVPGEDVLVIGAAFAGTTRLIDNIRVRVGAAGEAPADRRSPEHVS
jgi:pantoate--beta-alanine ligase